MSKKISKILFIFLFLIPISYLNAQDSATSVISEASEINLSSNENDISLSLDESTVDGSSSSESSSVWAFVKMVLVLAVVVACIYGVFFFFKKTSNVGTSSDPFLRRVSTISLSPGKSVQVVTLLDNAYVIGVTDNSINLIGQVNDKELVDAMNLYADKNNKTSKPRTFADVLDIFMPKNNRSENVFDSNSYDAAETLRRQRERFNDSDRGE